MKKSIIVALLIIFLILVTTNKYISAPLIVLAMFVGLVPSILLSLIFSFLVRPILGDLLPPHKGKMEMESMVSGFALSFYVGFLFLSLIFYFFLNRRIKTMASWHRIIINIVIAIILLFIIQSLVKINEIPSVSSAISYFLQ